jgi:hypothetical protein
MGIDFNDIVEAFDNEMLKKKERNIYIAEINKD